MDMQTLADRLEINDLLTRYAHSVDSKNWTLYRSVFTDDAFIDYESAGGIKGTREEVADWLEKTMAGFPMTQHLISNIDVTINGDAASVRAMFYNPMGMPSGKTFWCGGFYNHSLVRTADGWKSQRLIEESSWFDRAAEAMGQGD